MSLMTHSLVVGHLGAHCIHEVTQPQLRRSTLGVGHHVRSTSPVAESQVRLVLHEMPYVLRD